MVPVVLKKEQKLKILLKRIGEYITDDIRKEKIWQDWISGGKYFYFLMETEYIDKYNSLSIWFVPKTKDNWHLVIKKRSTVEYQEKYQTILDFDYLGNEEECVSEVKKLPVWWKIVDAIDNMCQTRLDQNPKYRTIQHEMADNKELDNWEEFLNKYYNPEKKQKYLEWKLRREQQKNEL